MDTAGSNGFPTLLSSAAADEHVAHRGLRRTRPGASAAIAFRFFIPIEHVSTLDDLQAPAPDAHMFVFRRPSSPFPSIRVPSSIFLCINPVTIARLLSHLLLIVIDEHFRSDPRSNEKPSRRFGRSLWAALLRS